jgi:hypothetical protein
VAEHLLPQHRQHYFRCTLAAATAALTVCLIVIMCLALLYANTHTHTHAQSDNFNSIMSGFGLDGNNPASMAAMTRGDGVEALLQALLHAARQKQQDGSSSISSTDNNSGSS